jgi:hypothetical protein
MDETSKTIVFAYALVLLFALGAVILAWHSGKPRIGHRPRHVR